ncbi:MAG: ATP-binding protein [Acidobacteria bacterium]|nr:ATP-binding protein [Acidobacteriota bacterium]
MSIPFQALVLLQAAVTACLALLALLHYARISRESYLRDWSAAWAAVSLSQVIVIPLVLFAEDPRLGPTLFAIQGTACFIQPALFFLAGRSLSRPPGGDRIRRFLLAGSIALSVGGGLWAATLLDPSLILRGKFSLLIRLLLLGPSLIYFGVEFFRHRCLSSRAGACATAASSILFGLHVMAISSGLLGVSIYRSQAVVAAALSVVFSLGSLLGITLTLIDEARKSSLQMADLIDSFHAILWESDPGISRFRFINDAANDLLGRPAPEWVSPNVSWMEHVDPAERESVEVQLAHCRATGEATVLEYRVNRPHAPAAYVRNHLRRGPKGEWRGVIVDDTERRAAAENLRISEFRQQQALDSAGAGLYDWDLETGSVFVSPRHYQLMGYDVGGFEPSEKFLTQAIHPDDSARLRAGMQEWLDHGGAPYVHQYRIRTRDGLYVWVESRGRLVESGGRRRVLGTLVDISHQKRAEFALEEARQRAQAADRAKSEFLANMSHEIRTPLSGILGLASLLEDMRLDAPAAELVHLISASGDALSQVLNDILDISKIEAGKLDINLVAVDLAATLDEVRRFFAPAAAVRNLELTIEPVPCTPCLVQADALRLRQVLFNLFSNALKFTETGSVTASVRLVGDPSARRVEVSVVDTGIGIPQNRLHELFQPFIQVDTSLTRRFGGTGLGLAITRNLTRLMGGLLQAESQPGAGSRFWFTLPLAQPVLADPGTLPARPPEPDLHGLRVLLAEDNAVNQLIARRAIEKTGASVQLAVDGLQALQSALEGAFDVILMDVQMPHLDGLEVTRRIRKEPLSSQPYIVALTAHAIEGYREICLEAGMNSYLTKPLQLDALRCVLAEANQGRQPAAPRRSRPT